MFRNNWDWFKMVYEFKNKDTRWLLSHAGVNPKWMENWSFKKDDIGKFNEWLNRKDSKFITSLESVSRFRGGWDYDGSPVWADIREYEWKSKEQMDNVGYDKQVCGHTYLNGNPVTFNNITCIDSQKVFYINSENELKEVNELKKAE